MWKWKCPICSKEIEEDFDLEYIANECIGCTHDCPECGGLVLINEGGICTDFESVLSRIVGQIDDMEQKGEIKYDQDTDEYIDVIQDDDS